MISLPSPGITLQSFFLILVFLFFVFFLERKRLWHGSLWKFKYEHTPLRFHFADLWQLTPSRHNDFRLSPLLSLLDAFHYITQSRVSVWNDYSPLVVKNIMSCVIALYVLVIFVFFLLFFFCGFLFFILIFFFLVRRSVVTNWNNWDWWFCSSLDGSYNWGSLLCPLWGAGPKPRSLYHQSIPSLLSPPPTWFT
jgi:hypothetical protein